MRPRTVFEELGGGTPGSLTRFGVGGLLRFWAGDAEHASQMLDRSVRHARLAGDGAQKTQSMRGRPAVRPLWTEAGRRGARSDRDGGSGAVGKASRVLEVDMLRVRSPARGDERAIRGRPAGTCDGHRSSRTRPGSVSPGAGIADNGAYVELLAGEPAEAERWLLPAWAVMERMNDWAHIATAATMLADALLDQGKYDETWKRIEAGERGCVPGDVDAEIGLRRTRARLLARRGDLAEAERLVRDAVARAENTDFLDLRARATADLGEILRLAGRSADSAAAVEEAIRLYELKGNVAAATTLRGKI